MAELSMIDPTARLDMDLSALDRLVVDAQSYPPPRIERGLRDVAKRWRRFAQERFAVLAAGGSYDDDSWNSRKGDETTVLEFESSNPDDFLRVFSDEDKRPKKKRKTTRSPRQRSKKSGRFMSGIMIDTAAMYEALDEDGGALGALEVIGPGPTVTVGYSNEPHPGSDISFAFLAEIHAQGSDTLPNRETVVEAPDAVNDEMSQILLQAYREHTVQVIGTRSW